MLLETLSQAFAKALATDATDTSFLSRVPTGTEPTNDGVINLSKDGAVCQNGILLIPYATAGDNDTFSMRLIGWRRLGNLSGTLLWIPVVLVELACTASAAVGVAGRLVPNTQRFADTITLVTGNDDVSVDIVSPTGDVIAHVMADLKGFQKVELTFDSTAAGATAMNCLYSLL
jgi:hypothetical protein